MEESILRVIHVHGDTRTPLKLSLSSRADKRERVLRMPGKLIAGEVDDRILLVQQDRVMPAVIGAPFE